MGSRLTVLVSWWCRAYTACAPEPVRIRRRLEIESHIWEATAAGCAGARILVEAILGAPDDLIWCHRERSAAGLPPAVLSSLGGSVIAFALVLGAYLRSLTPDHGGWGSTWMGGMAAAVLVLSWGSDRRRSRRPDRRPQI